LKVKKGSFASIHPKRVASNYLLSGIARCGYCGKALVGQDAKGGKFHYYVCGTLLKKGSGSCPAQYINSRRFEELVINKIKEHILTYENLIQLSFCSPTNFIQSGGLSKFNHLCFSQQTSGPENCSSLDGGQ